MLGKVPAMALVSRRVSKVAKAASPEAGLPFEEALKKLESIVEAMETSELPLEQLLTRFEEGTRLAQHCQTQLADAEVRVQKLEKTLGGRLELSPASAGEAGLAD
jgi:exodeoxyribonuclease VII small subunit